MRLVPEADPHASPAAGGEAPRQGTQGVCWRDCAKLQCKQVDDSKVIAVVLCVLFRALTKPFGAKGSRMDKANSAKPDAGETIEVFRVPLTKDQLRAIPSDERSLLLLASHAVNQISVLRRVLIFSLNYESATNMLENTLSAAQSQILLRVMLAILSETWVMLNRPI